jgi:hypothetical protein
MRPSRQTSPLFVFGAVKGTTMPRWGTSDDAKLQSLWRSPHNRVDHTKLDQSTVRAVHQAHFASTKYRNFAPLYRSKARAFGVSLTLDGHRKSKSLPLRAFRLI